MNDPTPTLAETTACNGGTLQPARYAPWDPRRFDHLSEAEVIRQIGALLAKALRRAERNRIMNPAASAPDNGRAAEADSMSLLRDETERQIVVFLQQAGPTAPRLIGQALGLRPKVLMHRLARLRAAGICEAVGHTRAARYQVRTDHSGN